MPSKRIVKEYAILFFATLIISISVYFFMMPNKVIVGSLSGLAIVLSHIMVIDVSIITLVLNVILLIIGFIFIGKEFGGKTVCTSVLMPVFLYVWERLFPNNKSLTGDVLIDVICYVLLVSFGLALLFNANASSGGLDIVAKLMNKYMRIEMGRAMSWAGMVTACASIIIYDKKALVISIVATYINGIVVDNFIGGFHRRKRVCILTDNYQEVQGYIMNTLKRGVTLYIAKGGYQDTEQVELVTILARHEYALLLEYLREAKAKTFVTVSTVNEVIGEWNS